MSNYDPYMEDLPPGGGGGGVSGPAPRAPGPQGPPGSKVGEDGQYIPDPNRQTDQAVPRPGGDVVDFCVSLLNKELLICKAFYFFFFSAFGSLFPLIAIYYKQLGMSGTQAGVLSGLRPLIEFVAAPFWIGLADKYKKAKIVLLCSLVAWVAFTMAIGFVMPPPVQCIVTNGTHNFLEPPVMKKRSLGTEPVSFVDDDFTMWQPNNMDLSESDMAPHVRRKRENLKPGSPPDFDRDAAPGIAPYWVDGSNVFNYDEQSQGRNLVKPPFSSIVYRESDVHEAFLLLLLLVVLGEFLSAPAIILADTATLEYLGDKSEKYDRQRMFGSFGWAIAMFFVGIALDNSTAFPDYPCGERFHLEKNYTICFATFSVLMSCAFLVATQFKFTYGTPLDEQQTQIHQVVEDSRLYTEHKDVDIVEAQLKITLTQHGTKTTGETVMDAAKSIVLRAQQKQEPKTKAVPKWVTVLKLYRSLRYGVFLTVMWFMGFGMGMVFTFLFWHLQDLGGSPTLFGVASVINHISEIVAFFWTSRLIERFGHINVLYIGLLGNVLRFLYISWLRNPWWVLPFEFVQGITHAAVWAAGCSYLAQATPVDLRPAAQGILQGIHHGLGRACGAIIGGIMIHVLGTAITFRAFGIACFVIGGLFALCQFFYRNKQLSDGGATSLDTDKNYVEESAVLAPCGVPMNPIGRSLSSSKMADASNAAQEGQDGSYGTYLHANTDDYS